VTANASAFACGPYAVPNALIETTCVFTNNPPCGAMRGFGAVQTCFAAEAQMDKLAQALEIEAHNFARSALSTDAAIGIMSFLSKQEPEFTGS
jgi:CO/xanthine dehydrogenase Mo-binding subunit